MILPFIYTRTRNVEYRLLTPSSLKDLSPQFVTLCRKAAQASIQADNTELGVPVKLLIKTSEGILWGVSCINSVLSSDCKDKANRLVRGFFGIILPSSTSTIPYDIDFFKALYAIYVQPVWDTLDDTYETPATAIPDFGNRTIKADKLCTEINKIASECHFFAYGCSEADYIAAVLKSNGPNSIITNIHHICQAVDLEESFMLMNAIMAPNINPPQKFSISTTQLLTNSEPDSVYTMTGRTDNIKRRQLYNTLEYCVYIIIALICAFMLFNGSWFWERVLPN